MMVACLLVEMYVTMQSVGLFIEIASYTISVSECQGPKEEGSWHKMRHCPDNNFCRGSGMVPWYE